MALNPVQFERLKQQLTAKQVATTETQAAQATEAPSYTERLGSQYKKRGENVIADISRPAELMNQGASPLKVAGAIGEAGLRTVGNVVGAAFDPLVEAVSPVISPVVKKIASIPGIESKIKDISALSQKYPEAFKDLEAVFNIATLGAGKVAEPVVKDLAGTAVKTAGKTIAPAGKTLKGVGEAAYGLTIPMEETTRLAMQGYQANQGSLMNRLKGMMTGQTKGAKPITEANTAARYGLVGTEWELGVQANKLQGEIWEKTVSPRLKAAKEVTDMRQFITEMRQDIIKNTPELGRRKDLLEALDAFSEDYKKVGKIGGEKLQEYKEGWAKNIPEATYKGKPIGSALKEIKNQAASKARQKIYEVVGPEGKQAYIDYTNLKSIAKSGIKSVKDPATRSFTRNVWEALMNKVLTPVATMGGKVLYKTGEGIEFIGNIGAKKVGDIIQKSDNLLEAGANITKDLPLGNSIKDITKGAGDDVVDALRTVKPTDFSKKGKLNMEAMEELEELVKKANQVGAKLTQEELNRGRELLKLAGR